MKLRKYTKKGGQKLILTVLLNPFKLKPWHQCLYWVLQYGFSTGNEQQNNPDMYNNDIMIRLGGIIGVNA